MKEWNYENDQWIKLPGELKHLPIFTRQVELVSIVFRFITWCFLKVAFTFYIRLKITGDFKRLYKKHPKMLIISNHGSHLDACSISAAIPLKYWIHLYITAAKDYWFINPFFTFFSQHCLGAIPVERFERKRESVVLCITLLTKLKRIWMIVFPEGGRSKDGYIKDFKKGVSFFSLETNTPILFLYLGGASKLWGKGQWIPKAGNLTLHVGPVQQPAPIEEINENYRKWALTINPKAYKDVKAVLKT